jgi:transcriptional regulator with XRE-family HTH domain
MKSDMALALAANTKKLMIEREWSQRELAKRAGLSQTAIGFVTRYQDANDRHAGLDTIEALARAFHVHAAELLGENPSRPARNVQRVAERAEPYEVQRSRTSAIDTGLLQLILEQTEKLPNLNAAQRAKLAAKVYAASVDGDQKVTRATVLKLVRSA